MIRKKIAILTGGQSSERKVALLSAQNVFNILKSKYDVKIFDFPKDKNIFIRRSNTFTAAIPIFHGQGGEDGAIQGFLKTLGIPFIFSDVMACAIGLDKAQSKLLARSLNLATPDFKVVSKGQKVSFRQAVVVKPLSGGSSLGINIAHTAKELDQALRLGRRFDQNILIEDYIAGTEYTVGVIEYQRRVRALPVVAILPKNKFFDYASKYNPKLVREICPAPISATLRKKLQTAALAMHRGIGARQISRSDFIVSRDKLFFIEINIIPGLTKNSLFPKAVNAANLDFLELFRDWLDRAKS